MPRSQPVFISLVGKAPQTDRLYKTLEEMAHKKCADLDYEFLGNPFEHYAKMRIDEKPKHEYSPPARTFFRLGLFYEFNETVVKPAFDKDPDFVVVRAYGYDLYHDAIEYRDCEKSLSIHKDLIPYTVFGLGLCPPEYMFTHDIGPEERKKMGRYFAEGSGQTRHILESSLSIDEKSLAIIDIIRSKSSARKKSKVA